MFRALFRLPGVVKTQVERINKIEADLKLAYTLIGVIASQMASLGKAAKKEKVMIDELLNFTAEDRN